MPGREPHSPALAHRVRQKNSALTVRRLQRPTHIPSQTNQPYEQDSKRRIGHFVGVGEPPLMKK